MESYSSTGDILILTDKASACPNCSLFLLSSVAINLFLVVVRSLLTSHKLKTHS